MHNIDIGHIVELNLDLKFRTLEDAAALEHSPEMFEVAVCDISLLYAMIVSHHLRV